MRWNHQSRADLSDAGEAARRAHSLWLTWALSCEDRFPRIPRQAVGDGGYEALLATPRGRAVCGRWWRRAFAAIERLTPSAFRGW
jgi:hypothetical protein